jgi:hypothetical protein
MIRLAPVLATVAVAAGLALPPAPDVQVTPVVSEGRVLTSLAAPDAWTVEVRELLQIGQLLTFEYDIELRRPSALWLDSQLARTSISTSAKYDTLTGGYQVSRLRDGRVVRSERRDQESEVRLWMTSVEQIQLEPQSALEPNQEYYIRVRMYMSPRRTVTVWPFGRNESSGRADFTYIR